MRDRVIATRLLGLVLSLVAVALLAGCHREPKTALPAPGSSDADKFLFDRGNESLAKKRWVAAREYFKKLVDTYPQSPYRQDAKLGIGDSYIGENTIESNILAANEFKEFLQYFPLNPRADYAQYKAGLAHFRQMLSAERDQTNTQDAITEFDVFLRNYPNSPYRGEVEKLRQQAKDRLSEASFKVGLLYYRIHNYAGAIARFRDVMTTNPEYVGRDGVYFYLAEIYHKLQQDAEALPLYDRLVKEFDKSDYLGKAQKRITELKR
jgi:outer membrane protein assembly factor BamD